MSEKDIMIGEGPAARSIKLDLPPFTLIGATTRAGSLTSPLRDRFGIVQRLEFYSVEDLTSIVTRSASCLNLELEDKAAIKARIEEATQYLPLEQLCLSPQCGFASTEEGNILTEEQQWKKLEFIRSIVEEVWGK